jgi:hypothetical protein
MPQHFRRPMVEASIAGDSLEMDYLFLLKADVGRLHLPALQIGWAALAEIDRPCSSRDLQGHCQMFVMSAKEMTACCLFVLLQVHFVLTRVTCCSHNRPQ